MIATAPVTADLGQELLGIIEQAIRDTCSIDDCDRPRWARGWCSKHYGRWRKHGSPQALLRPRPATERFWAKVIGDDYTKCWTWTAKVDTHGYGHFDGRMAHRFAYEHLIIEVPGDLVLDHLCRNRKCVNPWHLQPVTVRVNWERSIDSACQRRTDPQRCRRGHDLTKGAYVYQGQTSCRTCRNEASNRFKKKQRAA